MVTVSVENSNLVMRVSGFSKLLTFKNEISVPIKHVRGITADPGAFDMPRGIRSPGISVPGVVYAGTFYHEGDKVFWDVHNPAKTVVIELEGEDFKRFIVEVEDPLQVVKTLERSIGKSAS